MSYAWVIISKLQEMSLSRSSLLRNPIYDMNLYVHSEWIM
jgi:hypothetical protein